MQDNYVGDVGDYGKYGLLRNVTAAGLRLAVNWYRVVPARPGKQGDGKFTTYLHDPGTYRQYDPQLFDCLSFLVKTSRTIEAVEKSDILNAHFFTKPLTVAGREQWHKAALETTNEADIVFLDPDNGLETVKMNQDGSAKEKHVTWQEIKDYYNRGQSVILYHHRPQANSKEVCVQKMLEFQSNHLKADGVLALEYFRFTNRYYFLFAHQAHMPTLESVYHSVAKNWAGLCNPVGICRLPSDR